MVAVVVAAAGPTVLLLGSSGRSRLRNFVLATSGNLPRVLCRSYGILCGALFDLFLGGFLRRHAVMMLGDAVAKMMLPREIAVSRNLIVSSPLTYCT